MESSYVISKIYTGRDFDQNKESLFYVIETLRFESSRLKISRTSKDSKYNKLVLKLWLTQQLKGEQTSKWEGTYVLVENIYVHSILMRT